MPASSNSCLRRGEPLARMMSGTGSPPEAAASAPHAAASWVFCSLSMPGIVTQGRVQKGANPASRHFRFRRARNAAMGSMRTPRLLALMARSPWMFAT